MGEHKKIVVEHCPVDRLPEELRGKRESSAWVTITTEPEQTTLRPRRSLSEFIGKSGVAHTDPVADIRKLRDEWDD